MALADERKSSERKPDEPKEAVSRYKTILRDVLDSRPSGTRQRLADAIGKNRSFVTQITNPAYTVPIPMQHLPVILEICHLTGTERDQFLEAYHIAHPRRPTVVEGGRRLRHLTVDVPDFGNPAKNRRYDHMLKSMLQQLNTLADAASDEE